jgi:cytochrome c peroxidase
MQVGRKHPAASVRSLSTLLTASILLCFAISLSAQTDPGPRPAGTAFIFSATDQFGNTIKDTAQAGIGLAECSAAGCFLPGLTGPQTQMWFAGLATFGDVASVLGPVPGNTAEPIPGLGTMYNGTSCGMCHLQPSIGGSSPGIGTFGFLQNPQIPAATHRGAMNTVPSFITSTGPVREARFPQNIDTSGNPTGTLDGSVHELYTIEGRDDAPSGCNVPQNPFFQTEVNNNNVVFRIPTPLYGLGFVSTTSDAMLQNAVNAGQAMGFGTGGRFNIDPNDQTFTRFGWKAQNPSLLLFAGEAANVEMGVTNELFPFERLPGTCASNKTPEDFTIPTSSTTIKLNPAVNAANIESMAFFMFTNAPPAQCNWNSQVNPTTGQVQCLPLDSTAIHGQQVFNDLGCNSCHTTQLTTGPSTFVDLNNATFQPFSDFALHHMGSQLTDGVNQGVAGPDEFRTAPLWGLGQRLFLMHDGKNQDLLSAIRRHSASNSDCTSVTSPAESFMLNGSIVTIPGVTTLSCGSDADTVINNFNSRLLSTPQDIRDLYRFLRSL